jgi:hypothetical protein
VEHGTPKQLYAEIELDANAIAAVMRQMAKDKKMAKGVLQ